MTTLDFIGACFRCYKGACEYMDKLQVAFDIGLTECDVLTETICACERMKAHPNSPMNLGNALILCLFEKINNKAQEEYPHYAEQIRELFRYYVDDYASSIKFNHEQVDSWDELCIEIENWIKE